jgi:putative membrane protein
VGSPPPATTPASLAAQYARGFAMGSADIVPGVSGGTVALVLGIYHRLIANVRTGSLSLGSLAKGDPRTFVTRLREVEWLFLLPLGAGIGTAIIALSHTIETLLEEQPIRMSGLFFGLVIGSVIVASSLVQGWDPTRAGVAAASAVVTFFVLGLQQGPVEDPALWVYFGSGAIAICAMILPGISGSFLLLMLGMYDNVLGAVTDRDLLSLGVFTLGCVIGLAAFSQALHWGLVNHERTVLAALIGLMVGSLRVLWPWPDGTETNEMAMPSDDLVVPLLLAIVGVLVVVGVTKIAERLEGRSDEDLAGELAEP